MSKSLASLVFASSASALLVGGPAGVTMPHVGMHARALSPTMQANPLEMQQEGPLKSSWDFRHGAQIAIGHPCPLRCHTAGARALRG